MRALAWHAGGGHVRWAIARRRGGAKGVRVGDTVAQGAQEEDSAARMLAQPFPRPRRHIALRCRVGTSRVGSSDLELSRLCLGTMLMGEQHGWEESARLIMAAADLGVTSFDTAEMYPVPQRRETQGESERILGRAIKAIGRERVQVCTKVTGPSAEMEWIRGGPMRVDGNNILEAIDGSLSRLGTDYIDLYQIHWPDRYVPMFGDWEYDCRLRLPSVPLEEHLEALRKAQDAGKIRHVGLSNETPFGLMRCAEIARRNPSSAARVVALQNAYSLTCRTLDAGLSECCVEEGVGVLAYSPLAMGLLTGKYLSGLRRVGEGEGEGVGEEAPRGVTAQSRGGEMVRWRWGGPDGARLNRYRGRYAEGESRYAPRDAVVEAVKAYQGVAQEAGMSLTAMAIRFVLSHPLVSCAVAGATDEGQLRELAEAARLGPLEEGVLEAIDAVHARLPNPTP